MSSAGSKPAPPATLVIFGVTGDLARRLLVPALVNLRHEDLIYSLRPLHAGMRQYWRDFDALERWTRSEPHREWWKRYLKDTGGTGFWHETYFLRGGMEAIFVDMPETVGLASFAPIHAAVGHRNAARVRAGLAA